MRFRFGNACFLVVFLVIACGTVLLKGVSCFGVDFPDWTGINKERSYLEGRSYEGFPELSVDSLSSSEFQDSFEQYMSDLVPMKDSAMLLNAKLQRAGIETAAIPFGYDTYPTFFGSDYAYDRDADTVVQILSANAANFATDCELATDAFSDFANRHSDLNICFYRVDRMSSSSVNPTHELMSASVDTEFLTNNFFNKLSDEITVLDGTYDSYDSMIEDYFRTDHHWTAEAAFDAYVSIITELGFGALPKDSYEFVSYSVPFYGALSRPGLCLTETPDLINDYWFDISHLEVTLDGKKANGNELVHHDSYEGGGWSEDTFVNRYSEYYHGDYGLIKIHNDNVESGTLFVVADSFSNNMERFFAWHYRDVLVLDPRHTDITLESLLGEYGIGDVLFLLGSTNIATEATVASLS